ncbi:MAG: hypothetical protein HY905_26465 [Deltaproteobacteria bacterium]|nr:hypothetical protein [Deltaproteobacteria bacterium]
MSPCRPVASLPARRAVASALAPLVVDAVVALASSAGCVTTVVSRVPELDHGAMLGDGRVSPILEVRADLDEVSGDLLVTLAARVPEGAHWSSPDATECVSSDSWPTSLAFGLVGGAMTIAGIATAATFAWEDEHRPSSGSAEPDQSGSRILIISTPLLVLGFSGDLVALLAGLTNDPDEVECSTVRLTGADGRAAEPMPVAHFSVVVTRPDGTSLSAMSQDGMARVGLGPPLYDCAVECPAVGSPRPPLNIPADRLVVETLTIEATPLTGEQEGLEPPPTATTSIDVTLAPPPQM